MPVLSVTGQVVSRSSVKSVPSGRRPKRVKRRPVSKPIVKSSDTYREYLAMKKTPAFKVWKRRQFGKQEGNCYYCQEPLTGRRVNVEHIIPMSKGGTNKKSNMVLACSDCNREKGSRLLPKEERRNYERRLDDQIEAWKASQDYQAELAGWYRRNFET